MKTSKRVISLVLTAIMVMTSFVVAVPMLLVDADAATTIDGVTQERVVSNYETTYDNYAAQYLNGASTPTNIVIPGLPEAQDYVIQGMTYYPKRDWMLVTAYHNDATASSKVFALDAATGEFVAMFSFINTDGSVNMDHGGGIAVSEHNIYYSCGDKDRKIAYAPISALANAPLGQHTQIQLVAEADFVEVGSISYDSKTAYTAYVCYDEGVLWMGNFYDLGAKLLGVTIAANEYNAPANNTYNSMVFGYRLKGNDSASEWANLVSGSADCKGSPSYAIGLSNNLKDVQYATVDNGKLYLSRSYGSGAGNSINFGFGETSYLTVADIDLSVPGTVPITISTTSTGAKNKQVMAYDISDYREFPMMPMSEGLCVIDGDIYITFEGASNKYLNESSGLTSIGNCEKPVDVIWQLNPYDLMEVEVAEPEKSIYYEKVYSMDEIVNGKEYLIVYESAERDPVTQENILYAFNANGNFDGYKLSKCSTSAVKGYNGMIGHPISDYDAIDSDNDGNVDILYLNNPEKDDIESVRWTLDRKTGDNFRITSTLSYYANGNNLYFDADQIGMAPSNASYLNDLLLWQLFPGNGDFYFSNGQSYFLWCNDGTKAGYNNVINSYYANNSSDTPIYSGISEQPGTFHCDAVNATGSNIIGASVPLDDGHYYEGAFNIYKRVVDEVSSTYESRVYTNLDAELQADGTYTVTLDTYAISPNHYQYVSERPTDYIIVADTSQTMNITETKDSNVGSTGISSFNGSLTVNSMSQDSDTSDDKGTGVVGYGFYEPAEEIYFKHTDGKYYKAYMAISNYSMSSNKRQFYFVYYIADDGLYYCAVDHAFPTDSNGNRIGITQSEFKARVDNAISNYDKGIAVNYSDYSTQGTNGNRKKEDVYVGEHYRFDNVNSSYASEHTSLEALKTTANDLVDKIAAQNPNNRIALVQYGASNGYYNTSGSLATSGYTNALWSVSNKDGLKAKISALSAGLEGSNSSSMMDHVSNIMANSGSNYKAGGDRSVAVIVLSDGVPGTETSTRKGNFITGYYYLTETNESNATTVANQVISKANTIKRNGAFIYTVLFGNVSAGNFAKKTYMDAISSKYPAATSMTSLGGKSVDGVNYAMNIATCSINNFVEFGTQAREAVASNNAVGLDNLDANSYIREVLSEAFKFPEDSNYSVQTKFVPGEYDAIGRFKFSNAVNATGVTTNVDVQTKTITVTGYDYSTQYISSGNKGNALRIIITGLLADETAEISNTSINVKEKTGVFKTKDNMDNNVAFKFLPTEYFNIPEYTYVLDYGIAMYDDDVNGTLKSVSADLSAQRDANGNIAYKTMSENELVEISDNSLDLIYKSTPTNFADSGYCLIQRDDGTYDWFEIKVVPASNVLFEENYMNDGASGAAQWVKDGTTKTTYQTLTDNKNDVYGYDDAYKLAANEEVGHSYGSAYKAEVSSNAKRSATKTFDFVGDGIDLISACGANTGIMIVKISGGDLAKPKAYMVDTYYGGQNAVDTLIYQTPIVSFRGNHGTYTVEATAAYLSNAGALQGKITGSTLAGGKLSGTTAVPVNTQEAKDMLADLGIDLGNADLEMVWFDDNSVLNGGTGAKGNVKTARDGSTVTSLDCYLDGFRTYHPMKNPNDNYAESEKDAQYINVLDSINNNQIQTGSTVLDKIAYVIADKDGNKPSVAFADYQNVGPQNELYLEGSKTATDDALVLQVSLPAPTSRVQLGLRAVTGTATVKVGGTQFNINSATEMYYDVTNCVTTKDGIATITIQNDGANLLAVNHIKLTGGAAAPILEEEALEYAMLSMAAPAEKAELVNGVVTPIVPEDTTEPDTPVIPDDGGDDTQEPDAGDDNTTGDNSGTTGTTSFIEQLIAMIIDFIMSLFNFMPVGEVM